MKKYKKKIKEGKYRLNIFGKIEANFLGNSRFLAVN